MSSYGLDYEVWFKRGQIDQMKMASFYLYHDAEKYVATKWHPEDFTIVDKNG